MSLPKLSVSHYPVTLPVKGTELTVRPFLMREEKLLMIAFESGKPRLILDQMATLINDCVEEEIDVFDLSMIDAEYLLIKMKSFSRGESIELTMRCNHTIKDKEAEGGKRRCGCMTDLSVSLENLDDGIDASAILDNKIKLGPTIGVTLRPPRFSCLMSMLDEDVNETEHVMNVLSDSIESVWTEDEVFPTDVEGVESVKAFIDEMDAGQFKQVQAYFESLPEIKLQENFVCPSCKHKEVVNIRNINDFFV